MATRVIYSAGSLFALALLAAASGCCCQAIPLPGENQCPTDARRLYCSCGEEAVRRGPLGPDSEFYGLKPTCWREWPEGWHCNGCEGMPYVDPALCGQPATEFSSYADPTGAAPTVATPPKEANPFRPKAGAAELPTPPEARPMAPKQSAPQKTTSTQPRHTPLPTLEIAPNKNAPADKSTNDKSPPITGRVAVAQLDAPIVAPPAAPVVRANTNEPEPMPFPTVADATKIPAPILTLTAPALTLMPPLNAPNTVAEAQPSAEHKRTLEKTEFSNTEDLADDPSPSNRVEQHLFNNLQL